MPPVILDIIIKGTDHSRGMLVGFRQGVRGAAADTSGLKGHLDKLDRSLGGLNRDLDGLGGRWQNLSATGARVGMGMTAMGVGGAAAIGLMGRATLKASSDLNESNSKAGVVFGDAVGKVWAMADSAASAMGQSRQQALESASTFGNLFLGLGMGQEKAADLSIKMVRLATDLSSFNNIPMDVALEKIRSGLVGEVEPLRTVGVLLSEEKVALKAVEMGLAVNKNAVSEQAKVQARYALILEQTKTAQGDFARTSDGLANQQRILAAEFENTKAAVGDALAPAVSKLLKDLMPLVDKFAKLAKDNPQLIATLAKVAVGVTAINLTVGPLLMNSRALLSAWQLLGTAGKALAGLRIGGAVAGAVGGQAAGAAAASATAAGNAAGAAAGQAAGVAAGAGIAAAAPGIGARIAAGMSAASGSLVAIGLVIAGALVARAVWGFEQWKKAQGEEEKNAQAAAARGTAAGRGVGGTYVPARVGRESIDPEEAKKRGWVPTMPKGPNEEPEEYYVPAGAMPLSPEEQAKMLRARTRGPAQEGGPVVRLGAKPSPSEGTRIFQRFTQGSRDIVDPRLQAQKSAEEDAAFRAAHPEYGQGAGGAVPPVGTAAGGKGLPDPKEEKQYQDLLRAWQQRADLLEAQGRPEAEVAAAQSSLAGVYDAYAARLEASSLHLEAVDAQIAALRLRQAKKEAERTDTGLGGRNETWEDRLRNLQQRIDWTEAATDDPNAPATIAAKLQLIDGLKSYAAALVQSGKTQEATDLQIRAMRIEAELRKQGVPIRRAVPERPGARDPRYDPRYSSAALARERAIANAAALAQGQAQVAADDQRQREIGAAQREQLARMALLPVPAPLPTPQPQQAPARGLPAPPASPAPPATRAEIPLPAPHPIPARAPLEPAAAPLASRVGKGLLELGAVLNPLTSFLGLVAVGSEATGAITRATVRHYRAAALEAQPAARQRQPAAPKREVPILPPASLRPAPANLSLNLPPVPLDLAGLKEIAKPTPPIPAPAARLAANEPVPGPREPAPTPVPKVEARRGWQSPLIINPVIDFDALGRIVADWRKDRQALGGAPGPRAYAESSQRAYRTDVVPPGRDAAARAQAGQQAGGDGAGRSEVREVNLYIGGEKINERVRSEVIEVSRGAGRQP